MNMADHSWLLMLAVPISSGFHRENQPACALVQLLRWRHSISSLTWLGERNSRRMAHLSQLCREAGSASGMVAGGYRCASAYPSPGRSAKLGRQNLHLFRLKNTRFDVIGGLVFFFLVVRSAHAPSSKTVEQQPCVSVWRMA